MSLDHDCLDGSHPPAMSGQILTRLRTETRPAHTALEQLLDFQRLTTSRTYYRRVLQAFLGYYEPLERELSRLCHSTVGQNRLYARRTRALKRDLVSLDITEEELKRLPRAEVLPDCDSLPALWGCLYVLEGANLGGQVIAQHLQRTLGLTSTTGCEFFHGYGAQTSLMWDQFRSTLSACADLWRPSMADTAVEVATATFHTFGQWLEKCLEEPAR